jgi:PhnB protein
MKHEGTPAEGQVPTEWNDKIIHARIELGRTVVMASDAPPGHQQKPQGFRLMLGVDSVAEAERAFNVLAEGATVEMPLEKTFFADKFGMLTDRFGTPWMISYETPSA